MFYYLFGWEMIHLHTVSGQGVCDYDQFWSLAGRVAQCCGSYAQFFVLLCNLIIYVLKKNFNLYTVYWVFSICIIIIDVY